ncbi:putative protein tag-76 [Trichinella patagoniensis]|uniref:Protein argonaute-3 n=2 Tax=Trichinella TaxID=6333 RepID=A0A0V0Z6F8_9BILA|nr:putative protein tag-76 [Trichinella patagoniensis]
MWSVHLPCKLLLLFCSQLVLLPMSETSQDTNVAADELLQKELVKRPGYGTVGKPIKLACNYFPLIKLQKGDIMVNRYHIDIQHTRLNDDNRDVFWAYVVKRSDIFGDPFKLAYDGKSTLFTVDKLHLKQVSEKADPEKFSFKTVRENKPSELSILIKFTGLVHLDFRNAEAGSLDEREKGPVQFLDILFAQGRSSPLFELSKSFKAVRNSFYCIPHGAGADMKYGIELWRGLFISVRVIDGFRPAINIDGVMEIRHHARFVCCHEAAARGRGKNIPAGTVIDRVVTSPNEYDFFLCSHHGIQGTSRPTRYYVLFDESNMDVNAMQSITYYLCHLYGRCARSVSIPAPVYFADLACARARYHILAALNSGLVEKFSDEDSKRTGGSSSSKAESVKTELANIIALHKRGTSRPTRYYVLFDESNMDVNAMQSITYYLCHLYGRCARSVSIPAPVYFADLACARALEKFSDEDSKRTGGSSSSQDTNVAADELLQKELVKRPGYGTVGKPIKLACNYFPLIKLQKGQDTNVAADELLQKELVKRPGYGTVGKPIKLACNYFPLIKLQKGDIMKGDIMVNRYHIDIQHPRLNDDNRDIFWAYVVKRSDIFGDPFKLAYDGKSTLFTVDKLHLKQVSEKADPEKFSFKTVRENKPSELSILIKFTGLVHLDFRNAEAGSLDEREKGPVQFLDILFAQGRSSPLFELSKSFKAVRNSFYCIPHGAGADMKYGIELWRGLFISVRVIDGFRPAINIDVSHSCFYKRQSLINLICDILNGNEREVKFHPNQLRLNTRLQPEQLSLLIPELKGVSIHTTHRNQDRIYRIKDILSTAVSMKFERDGKEVSVAEYFHDVYGPLKYPNLPLVQVGSKSKPIYFPVELCQVANCQRYNKKLKACQTTSIIRFASTDAPTRNLKCIEMVKKSNFNSDPFLKSFGVQIKAEPMIVDGRVLPPPRLEYGKGNGGRQIILTPKDGAWNSNEFKFFESASCKSFGFVSFLPPHKASMLQEFCLQIVRTCRSTGIVMPDRPKYYEQAQKNDSVEMVFKRIADKCDRDGIKCDLVFVALFSSEQYAQVKSCGDITFGLVTQCLLPKTISDVAVKKSYSTMLNIAMKINMKIGGINTKLLEDENNALVIGVDVVHPSAVETHLPSIASVGIIHFIVLSNY